MRAGGGSAGQHLAGHVTVGDDLAGLILEALGLARYATTDGIQETEYFLVQARRRVLQLLRERPMTAGELAEHFNVSRPTMSAHFAVLREANLIDATKKGTTITYRIRMSVLEEALLGFAGALGLDVKRAHRRALPRRTVTKEA